MSSQAVPPNLFLTQRLADGTIEWLPVQQAQQLAVEPGAAYALIDRSTGFSAPPLLARRRGEDLVVEVNAAEVLVLEGFFAAQDIAFYPEPDIASGAGPFSGQPVTPETTLLAGAPESAQVVWSAVPVEPEEPVVEPVPYSDGGNNGGMSPLVWVGVGVGALGIAAAAGGGGGGGSGRSAPPPVADDDSGGDTTDTTPPQITSDAVADPIAENSGAGQVVYRALATDSGTITWSLEGPDAAALRIDADSGVVTLTNNPDFETQSSYGFTVVATDAAGNSSRQAVTLDISNTGDEQLRITSGGSADAVDENSGSDQTVYTATTDGDVTWSLAAGGDAANFTINANSGAVRLRENPNHEAQSSYTFTVVATDAVGNTGQQSVALAVNDLDEVAPSITSGASARAIDENSGSGQIVYTVTSTDTGDISTGATTYSLRPNGDGRAFTIDGDSGAVALVANPDFETQSSYSFTVVATDAAGNNSQQTVSLSINNTGDQELIITSGANATAIDENSGAGQAVYTATVNEDVTWSLASGGDAAAFSINPDSGVVSLRGNPDHEVQSSYAFTVVATDAVGNAGRQPVTLTINDLDEVAPAITSGASAQAIDENSGAGQVIYTVTSTDTDDISTGNTSYSLGAGGDAGAFTINSGSGAITLVANPDFETQDSYNFTVVATDAAGNNSSQAVSLAVNNVDEVAPSITSGATAQAIDENSGAGQVIYTVTSTDVGDISTGNTSYSLSANGDAAAFTIDGASGAVTLVGNPDFETQSSYNFTVVATDTAGNSSELAVALAVNDLDDNAPVVTAIGLSTAVGAQNDTLNAGDTVRVSVTMSEAITVETGGGIPRVGLNIGGSAVVADFVSGSGSANLIFEYVIQPGDTDADGISIDANALDSNGASLTDSFGNAADLSHGAVDSNSAFLVDTIAPSLTASVPADDASAVVVGDDIVLTFSESVQVGSGNITISDGADVRVIDIAGGQVNVSGTQVTIDPGADLNTSSNYNVQIESGALTDAAGNAYAGIADPTTLNFETEGPGVDTSVVVFDLVQGVSSDHSNREFDPNVSYEIYIRVDSDSATLSTAGDGPGTWGRWRGADNLGSDDRIILVGDGAPVVGRFDNLVSQISIDGESADWETSSDRDAVVLDGRSIARITGGTAPAFELLRVFDRAPGTEFFNGQGGNLGTMYRTDMPEGILTSQGLA